MGTIPKTPRTKLRRLPKRGFYDRSTIDAILDETFICHVGFVVDGAPFVIPTSCARFGDRLLIHGSAASRMTTTLARGIEVCVTVTLLDGLVLARSVFEHSMNYRSVVIFGQAMLVENPAEKRDALRLFSEHILPGRWDDARQPNENELAATTVLSLPIQEASAKVRNGPPIDKEEDLGLRVWAGVIPLSLQRGKPIADSSTAELPGYIQNDPRWSKREA